MGIKYISGFRGADHAKQHLRRSVHLGSALTSSYTVLSTAEAFDQQACFVYLNGALLKEGTSGAGGDYVLSGTTTITFNTAVATTDSTPAWPCAAWTTRRQRNCSSTRCSRRAGAR